MRKLPLAAALLVGSVIATDAFAWAMRATRWYAR
jgi:hypothetical protein